MLNVLKGVAGLVCNAGVFRPRRQCLGEAQSECGMKQGEVRFGKAGMPY